jgi:hypothetical protein
MALGDSHTLRNAVLFSCPADFSSSRALLLSAGHDVVFHLKVLAKRCQGIEKITLELQVQKRERVLERCMGFLAVATV